jgi:diguanylate cyclase (GGDEF)-like protein
MRATGGISTELDAAKRKLAAVTAEVARNHDKMRRSQQRELRLLQAEDMQSLFRELVTGLRASYELEYVSLLLCDPDHDIPHLLLAGAEVIPDIEGLLFVESMTGLAPQYIALQEPWLGPYAACDHQLVFPCASNLASVAMIPLLHRHKLIGSLNFGSSSAQRFTRQHATDFLAHLGVISSYCVENVVNRARLMRSGFTDVLTGWHNRRYLLVRLAEELARASRERSNLVCLMLDIDHFKKVNDQFGHAAGDAVLRELAQRIESQVRRSDVAARMGGEEFVVLLPGTGTKDGIRLAERIRRAISGTPVVLPDAAQLSVTASIGIAGATPSARGGDLKTLGDSLLARADVALYRAKSEGRDRVAVDESE